MSEPQPQNTKTMTPRELEELHRLREMERKYGKMMKVIEGIMGDFDPVVTNSLPDKKLTIDAVKAREGALRDKTILTSKIDELRDKIAEKNVDPSEKGYLEEKQGLLKSDLNHYADPNLVAYNHLLQAVKGPFYSEMIEEPSTKKPGTDRSVSKVFGLNARKRTSQNGPATTATGTPPAEPPGIR